MPLGIYETTRNEFKCDMRAAIIQAMILGLEFNCQLIINSPASKLYAVNSRYIDIKMVYYIKNMGIIAGKCIIPIHLRDLKKINLESTSLEC